MCQFLRTKWMSMKNWEKRLYKTLNVLKLKMLKCRKVRFRCSFMGHKTSLPQYKTIEVRRKDPTTIEKQICVFVFHLVSSGMLLFSAQVLCVCPLSSCPALLLESSGWHRAGSVLLCTNSGRGAGAGRAQVHAWGGGGGGGSGRKVNWATGLEGKSWKGKIREREKEQEKKRCNYNI